MYGLRGNIRNKTLPATAFAVVGIFKIAYYFPFLDFLIQLFGLFYVQNYLWELVSFFGDIHVGKGKKIWVKNFLKVKSFWVRWPAISRTPTIRRSPEGPEACCVKLSIFEIMKKIHAINLLVGSENYRANVEFENGTTEWIPILGGAASVEGLTKENCLSKLDLREHAEYGKYLLRKRELKHSIFW